MKHIVHKYSSPGWQKVFDCEYDARQELLSHICKDCVEGRDVYIGYNGFEEEFVEPPDKYCIESLLGTSCGCEFGYEEVE